MPCTHDESAEHHAERASLLDARRSFVEFAEALHKCAVYVECFLVSCVGVDDVVRYAGEFGESVKKWAVDLIEALKYVGSGTGVWSVGGAVVF